MSLHRIRRIVVLVVLGSVSGCAAGETTGPSSVELTPSATVVASATASTTSSDAGTASAAASPTPVPTTTALTSDPLHGLSLVDVRTGESLTLGELAAEKPLLVEMMAIWCTNCRAQMHEVTEAHGSADFHSLSIDVEPFEAPEDLAAYAADEGFDWPFAKADADIASALRERFGTAVLNPPGMPKLLFGTDGSVELLPLNDELTAAELVALIDG